MADVIVVGGGYWGTSIAFQLRCAGAKVLVFDDGHPRGASRNSAGMFKRGWWKKGSAALRMVPDDWDWFRGASVDWLPDGLVSWTGDEFASTRRPRWRYSDDCAIVDPERVLSLALSIPKRVTRLERDLAGWAVQTASGDRYEASTVVLAAGVWTDPLLVRSGLSPVGVRPMRGRGALFDAERPVRPRAFQFRPYVHYTVRPWTTHLARLGDTVDREPSAEVPWPREWGEARVLFFGEDAHPVRVFDGLRPVSDSGYVLRALEPGLIVATGGHRVGLGLAGPVGERVVEMLG